MNTLKKIKNLENSGGGGGGGGGGGVLSSNGVVRVRRGKKGEKKVLKQLRQHSMNQLTSIPASRFSYESESPLGGLSIPLKESDRLRQFLSDNSQDPMIYDYLASLISPKKAMCRVPDSFARPTALVRSIATYDINTPMDTSINSGRFSVAVSPILGSPNANAPSSWKIAQVGPVSGAWPSDFTVPAAFVQIVGGNDIRVDPFYGLLTQQPPALLTLLASVPASTNPFGSGATVGPNSYGLGFTLDLTQNPARLQLPIGQYLVVAQVNGANGPITTVAFVPGNLAVAPAGVYNVPTNSSAVYYFNVQNPGEYLSFALGTALATSFSVSIATVQTAFGGSANDFGAVTQIRPVAMSVLASYIGTTLQDGGNIAASYVPGSTLNSNYFVQAGNLGQNTNGCFEYWEQLSKQPSAYNGPLRDGAYVWWSPEDYEDIQMFKPSLSATMHRYPAIIVSGQFNNGLTTGIVPCIRLEVVTTYEFTTNSLLFETQSYLGSQAKMDAANAALFGQPHSMPNAIHLKWISDLAKKIASGVGSGLRYVTKNKDTLLPILGSLGALL